VGPLANGYANLPELLLFLVMQLIPLIYRELNVLVGPRRQKAVMDSCACNRSFQGIPVQQRQLLPAGSYGLLPCTHMHLAPHILTSRLTKSRSKSSSAAQQACQGFMHLNPSTSSSDHATNTCRLLPPHMHDVRLWRSCLKVINVTLNMAACSVQGKPSNVALILILDGLAGATCTVV
jgi:hypothetical protein